MHASILDFPSRKRLEFVTTAPNTPWISLLHNNLHGASCVWLQVLFMREVQHSVFELFQQSATPQCSPHSLLQHAFPSGAIIPRNALHEAWPVLKFTMCDSST